MLTAVKEWSGDGGVRRGGMAATILDGARDVIAKAGRDEETALRSNQETLFRP
jgi:hypothetical protein